MHFNETATVTQYSPDGNTIMTRQETETSVEVCVAPALLVIISISNVALVSVLLQERPAVADKPARRLRNVCMVYVRAVGL